MILRLLSSETCGNSSSSFTAVALGMGEVSRGHDIAIAQSLDYLLDSRVVRTYPAHPHGGSSKLNF
jgi:hypothetical protein